MLTTPDDYQNELRGCRLSESVAKLHMDPEFEVFRQMNDPSYWALDILYNRLALHQESADAVVNTLNTDWRCASPA